MFSASMSSILWIVLKDMSIHTLLCQFTLLYCEHTVVENVSESLKYTWGMKYKKKKKAFRGVLFLLFNMYLFTAQKFHILQYSHSVVRSNPNCSGCVLTITEMLRTQYIVVSWPLINQLICFLICLSCHLYICIYPLRNLGEYNKPTLKIHTRILH